MAEKQYINKENPVYFSYYKADDKCSDIEESVKKICAVLDANGICYKRNGDSDIPYCASLDEIQRETGRGALVIVIISKGYIESLDCMHEWHCIRENGKIWERVLPVVMEDAKLRDKEVFMDYYDYFCKRKEVLIKQQSEDIIPLAKSESNAAEFGYYIEDLKNMYKYLADTNYRFDDCSVLVGRIREVLKEDSEPRFRVPMAQNLIDRPDAVAALNEQIKDNQFVNMTGIGGSGKTSLMSLWVNKHKDDYNQIAYAVVNNSVKDDIVTQLNKTLKLADFEKIQDKYGAIMDYLSENYDSDKPNLMIVDINKALENEVKDFVNEVVNEESLPLGWKCLVISRERKYGDNNFLFNLNDYEKENTEFLKELFLKKAGDGYKDFGDFDRLFRLLHNSPLLVEQLGIFLQDLPKKSFDDINELLHKDIFRNQKRVGVTSKNRNESEAEQTIIGFLIRLVDFTQFKENEKELLRHFVLWPTDYISKKVIQGLLAGIIESEDAFEEVFVNLIKRGIITAQTNSNGEEEYKLHGLIAESIREQIEIKKEDYKQYLDNIKQLKKLDFENFSQFSHCICYCLANYYKELELDIDYMKEIFSIFRKQFLFKLDQMITKLDYLVSFRRDF